MWLRTSIFYCDIVNISVANTTDFIVLRSGGRAVQQLKVRAAPIESQNLARKSNILWVILLARCADSLCRSTRTGAEYLEARQQEASAREPPANTTQSGTKPSLWVTELLQINDNLCFPEGSQLSVGSSPTILGSHPTICLGTASWTGHLPRLCLFGNRDREESLMALRAVISVLHLGTSQSSSSVLLTQSVSPCFT